ncbi:hypothetical protein AVEN_8609-1 [Araneus ventricosus]|uniref:Uncharacterized protein n=1 Tax=Araneus ventricosus TaxID=182803 RepID=A0A4Y2C3M7_ARAVE|nr:hypothetical protein AVEN_8609-1 [Araneus ventricosus]
MAWGAEVIIFFIVVSDIMAYFLFLFADLILIDDEILIFRDKSASCNTAEAINPTSLSDTPVLNAADAIREKEMLLQATGVDVLSNSTSSQSDSSKRSHNESSEEFVAHRATPSYCDVY